VFYDHFAARRKHPLGIWVHRAQARILASQVVSISPPPQRVLEVGPGDGYFAEECIRRGFTYVGLEACPSLTQEHTNRGFDVCTTVVPPIPVASESVDICCMFHVLEHVPTADIAQLLVRETRRVLRTGGYLYLACPNYYTWGRDFFEDDYSHNYITTPRRVRQLLLDGGYRVLKLEFYSGPVFGWRRFAPLLANRLLYWRWLNRLVCSDRYYQGFLTFLECFTILAQSVET
jgi:SAM-dependent methyltransferase